MSQFWIGNVPGSTVTSSQAENLAVIGRGLSTTTLAGTLAALSGVNASVDEINNKVDGSASYVIPLASTALGAGYTLAASNTGRIHMIAATTAANCALVLPAEAAGLNYKIIYVGSADETENYTIGTEAAANFFIGGLAHLDVDVGSSGAGFSIATAYSDGNSNSLLTLTNPCAGTEVNLVCDGTHWYVWGMVVADTAPAFSDT